MGESVKKSMQLLSWVPLDTDYKNRDGFRSDFLARPIALPKLGKSIKKIATQDVLAYEHFSVLLNPDRKLAFWTAVNIDGALARRVRTRAADKWWPDRRAGKQIQITNTFYTNSGFERGHLVRRLDPAWGPDDDEACRAEADSFHFTNCSPQLPKLNKNWWGKVENHVLDTANANHQRISVFSGCYFTDEDPTYKKVQIPLAFWKVVAWTVGAKGKEELRSLAFIVKQDEGVAALIQAKGVQPLAVQMGNVPSEIQGYQTTVAELEAKTDLSFGALARQEVDVYARARSKRLAPLAFNAIDVYRRLRRPADLITE